MCVRQKASLITAAAGAPGASSLSVSARPSAGATPIAAKKLPVTRRPRSRSARSSPVIVAGSSRVSASAVNERARFRQSR